MPGAGGRTHATPTADRLASFDVPLRRGPRQAGEVPSLPDRLRRSGGAACRERDRSGRLGIGSPAGVGQDRFRSGSGPHDVADELALQQERHRRPPIATGLTYRLRDQRPVRDADGRDVHDGAEMESEAGSSWMIPTGRVHEQHIEGGVELSDG